jgi:hypothetical protein
MIRAAPGGTGTKGLKKMKKLTAKQVVKEQIESLRGMDVAGLTQAGKAAGFDSRAGFTAWKKALAGAGIDYNSLRDARREERQEEREASVTHGVTFYSDAKASAERFAICDRGGSPVWYGRFFDDDRDFDGEQSSGEMAAAKKAVWLASKVAQAVGGVVRLTLKVDAEWLTWANGTDPRRGGGARDLRCAAQRLGVVLEVEHIAGTSNPADEYTTGHGFARWQDTDLAGLVDGAERRVAEAVVVEPEPVMSAPAAIAEPVRESRPLTAAERASLDFADLEAMNPLRRKQRKAFLFEAKLPSRAEALDEIERRLEAL